MVCIVIKAVALSIAAFELAASLLASDAHGAVDPSLGFVVSAGHLLVVPVVRPAHEKRHTAHSAGCCNDQQGTQA
jgi:pyruvate/2-oxoglutarate dehydrogenase complex dihydrolipoamide acyltransferase (E2) component